MKIATNIKQKETNMLEGLLPAGWTPDAKALNKVSNYYDADLYARVYLEGQPPLATWGLAECSNYQFLSYSTVFGTTLSKYKFPHPAKEHMAKDPLVEGGYTYFDGTPGYGVEHMAQKSLTEHYLTETGFGHKLGTTIRNTNTTNDKKVHEDYAKITIPRTIDYVTGLANYFFRGRLSVEVDSSWWPDIELAIVNHSVNSDVGQTLKGGTFELYWDNAAGDRTQVSSFAIDGGWTSSSTLPYNNEPIIATFTEPAERPYSYVLVYKGNICADPAEPDLDDQDAIAVAGRITDNRSIWKLDSSGSLVWGYDTGAETKGVVVDGSGNVYVAGYRGGSFDELAVWKFNSLGGLAWGYSLPGGNGIAVDSSGNVYVANNRGAFKKLDSSGSLVYEPEFGGIGWGYGWGIAVDSSDNFYVVGSITDSTGETAGVCKLDSSCSMVWSRHCCGFYQEYNAPGVAVDSSGYVYIADFLGVHKRDSSGSLVWSNGNDWARGVAVDDSGNVYVAGRSRVWKLDSSGSPVWDRPTGGLGDVVGAFGIAVDSSGNVYAVGARNPYVESAPSVWKYDSSGSTVWTFDTGGDAYGVAVDDDGYVYVAGDPRYYPY
jgi:hypothetical protein